MPMHSHPIVDESGRVIGRACVRERRRSCFTCSAPNASLSCDGCDHVLCTGCAVGPTSKLDFCPKCFEPAWRHWCSITAVASMTKPERRQAFRLWARANAEKFLELAKPRTKKSHAEVP